MRQVEITGLGVDDSTLTPVVVLREQEAPHRMLPIFVGGPEALAIGLALTGKTPARPLTHDLMADVIQSLHCRVDSAEVTELRDGAFIAELAISGPAGGRRLDTRPSDAIALALRLHAPLFVSDAVLDEAGMIPDDIEPRVDGDAIDEQVADFASLLDQLDRLDPADFGDDAVGPDDHDGPDA
ncbi:MAG TPA: bifunctional nuclease family protein [Acidimicrobiales bacterium]|nr:bifunctional nuclease family protein [Acidimicrobiales bacterium]